MTHVKLPLYRSKRIVEINPDEVLAVDRGGSFTLLRMHDGVRNEVDLPFLDTLRMLSDGRSS